MSFSNAMVGAKEGSIGGPYGAAGGFVDGLIGGPIFKSMNGSGSSGNTVKLGKIKPDPISTTFDQFLAQGSQLPDLGEFSNTLNKYYQDQISKVAPDYFSSLKEASSAAASEAKGLIPADVMAAAIRNSGLQAVKGGYGGGSDMGRANVARQLGLTSLDLQGKAAASLPMIEGLAKDANPVNPINFIFTPQAIQQRSDQVQALNAGLTNQQTMINYAIGQQNQQNQLALFSSMASMFGGSRGITNMFTGNGNGGGIPSWFGSMGGGGSDAALNDYYAAVGQYGEGNFGYDAAGAITTDGYGGGI